MSPLLEVRNLSCSVDTHSSLSFTRKKKTVLNNVTFILEKGMTLGLLGGSGSGKSTLARCIAGLQTPTNGDILFEGINISPSVENRRRIPRQIQMLFQASGASLNPIMTIRECIDEGVAAGTKLGETAEDGTRELLGAVGLSDDLLARVPSELSGGQRQRVALARAIAVQPKLCILDEPTSALDILTQQTILALLKQLQIKHGFSLLFITHDVHVALTFCERIALLHEGTIVEENSSDALRRHPQHYFTQKLFADCGISFSTTPLSPP